MPYSESGRNLNGVALVSAIRTATALSDTIDNVASNYMHAWLNVTSAPGVDTVTLVIQIQDPASGVWQNFAASSAVSVNGTYRVQAANCPKTMRIQVSHSGAGAFTYSVGYSVIAA